MYNSNMVTMYGISSKLLLNPVLIMMTNLLVHLCLMVKLLWPQPDQTKLYLFIHMMMLTKMDVGYMEVKTEMLKVYKLQLEKII